jgi:hypothetical protein
MGESGRRRAEQFSWEAVTARVEEYYGFVIRRLAGAGALPPGFRARIPEAPARVAPAPRLWSTRADASQDADGTLGSRPAGDADDEEGGDVVTAEGDAATHPAEPETSADADAPLVGGSPWRP